MMHAQQPEIDQRARQAKERAGATKLAPGGRTAGGIAEDDQARQHPEQHQQQDDGKIDEMQAEHGVTLQQRRLLPTEKEGTRPSLFCMNLSVRLAQSSARSA